VRRRPRCAASAWNTTAWGITTVRWPAALVEDPAADQHPGGVDREHVPGLGVLALVVLPALEPGLASAGAGDRDAELQQPLQRGPLAQHRAEDVGVRVISGPGQQRQQGLRVRAGIVVEHPHPLGVDAELVEVGQAGVQRGRERGARGHPDDTVLAERLRQQHDAVVLAAGVDRDGVRDGRELAGQPLEHRRQPPRAVVADQHHRDVLAQSRGPRRVTRIGDGHDRSQ
jgi:hypothetical protein